MTHQAHVVGARAGNDGRTALIQYGGALGIASCFIGLLIFLAACAGFNAAFMFSVIPALLAAAGVVLTIIGGAFNSHLTVEHTHVLGALFINIIAVIGSLLLLAVWLDFPLFARSAAM